MLRASFPFGPADFLREALRLLPELEDELAPWSDAPPAVLVDAVAYETYAWVRSADEADYDVVFRVFDFWSDVLERGGVDPEVKNALTTALGLLRVGERLYGRKAAERASPRMRQLMEDVHRVVSLLGNSSGDTPSVL